MLNFIIINHPFVDVNIFFFLGDVRKSLVCVVVTGCSELNIRIITETQQGVKYKVYASICPISCTVFFQRGFIFCLEDGGRSSLQNVSLSFYA